MGIGGWTWLVIAAIGLIALILIGVAGVRAVIHAFRWASRDPTFIPYALACASLAAN